MKNNGRVGANNEIFYWFKTPEEAKVIVDGGGEFAELSLTNELSSVTR